jgi:hypothetical protein
MAFAGGQLLTAQLLNETFEEDISDTQATQGTTTATAYTATLSGGVACGLVFVAPLSGAVKVFNNATLLNSTTSISYCTFRIKTGGTIGSGTDFVGALDINAIYHGGSTVSRHGEGILITGLTPGFIYNIQQLFKITGGASTLTTNNKHLAVAPAAAA